jgi:hypothetical protein
VYASRTVTSYSTDSNGNSTSSSRQEQYMQTPAGSSGPSGSTGPSGCPGPNGTKGSHGGHGRNTADAGDGSVCYQITEPDTGRVLESASDRFNVRQ